MSANIDQQAQEDFIKCWNGFKPYEKPVYQEFKDGFLCGHQAATSRQEAKIKALVEALEQIKHSITQMQMPENDKRREVLLIQNTVAEAIAAAKETP